MTAAIILLYICFSTKPTLLIIVAKHLRILWIATVACCSGGERTVSDACLISTASNIGHDARHLGTLVPGAKCSAKVVSQGVTVNSGIIVVPLLIAHRWVQAVHTELDQSWLACWFHCLDTCTLTAYYPPYHLHKKQQLKTASCPPSA